MLMTARGFSQCNMAVDTSAAADVKSYFLQRNENNSYLCIGHYRDILTAIGTFVLTSTLILPSPMTWAALSMFQSILRSLGQSMNPR
jgi:hypothetical protein